MNKAPAWSRVPRHRKPVSLYDNGWRENDSQELLVSYPQLDLKLAELIGAESAVINHDDLTITITVDGIENVIGTGELSDFIVSREDFIKLRSAIALRDPEGSDVVSLTLEVGSDQTLTAYIIYDDGSEDVIDLTEANVTLSSEGVIDFNQETGVVTALGPGEIQMVVSAFNLNAILDVVVESVVVVEHETRTEPVPYETQRVDNDELPVGTEEVSQEGVDGVRTIVELVTYHNGVEVDREVLSNEITTPAVPEIIQVGTKEEPEE